AQAERINTAIRELTSHGRPSKSINPVRAAHTGLTAALAGNVPHLIHSDANVTAIIADTAHNIPGGTLDRRYLDNLFRDLSAGALAMVRNAAEEMREHENWRAS